MDLINQLTQHLGIDSQRAQGVAGGLLGMVQDTAKDKLGDDAAHKIEADIPELPAWKQAAQTAAPAPGGDILGSALGKLGGTAQEGGGLGGLLGGAGGAGGIGGIAALLGNLNIDPAKLGGIGGIVMQFLKTRLDGDLVSKLAQVVPLLSGGGNPTQAPDGAAGPAGFGGLGAGLGGLFGGDK